MSAVCLCNAYRVFLNVLLIEGELFLKDRYFDLTVKFKSWRHVNGGFCLCFWKNCGSHRDEHRSFNVLVVYDEHIL